SLLFGDDWHDPYYASGVRAQLDLWRHGSWSLVTSARAERQRSAELTTTYSLFGDAASVRPVRAIDEGDQFAATLDLRHETASPVGGWRGGIRVGAGRLVGVERNFDFT